MYRYSSFIILIFCKGNFHHLVKLKYSSNFSPFMTWGRSQQPSNMISQHAEIWCENFMLIKNKMLWK